MSKHRVVEMVKFNVHDSDPFRGMADIYKDVRGVFNFRFSKNGILVEEIDTSDIVRARFELKASRIQEYYYGVVDREGNDVPEHSFRTNATIFHDSMKSGGKKVIYNVSLKVRRRNLKNSMMEVTRVVSEGGKPRIHITEITEERAPEGSVLEDPIDYYGDFFKNTSPTAKFTTDTIAETIKAHKNNKCNNVHFIWDETTRRLECDGYIQNKRRSRGLLDHDTMYVPPEGSEEEQSDITMMQFGMSVVSWMTKIPSIHSRCVIQCYISEEHELILLRVMMGSYGWASFSLKQPK